MLRTDGNRITETGGKDCEGIKYIGRRAEKVKALQINRVGQDTPQEIS